MKVEARFLASHIYEECEKIRCCHSGCAFVGSKNQVECHVNLHNNLKSTLVNSTKQLNVLKTNLDKLCQNGCDNAFMVIQVAELTSLTNKITKKVKVMEAEVLKKQQELNKKNVTL
jgi:hypothetical protein